MAANVPNSAELIVANLMLGAKSSTGLKVRLFKNDIDPMQQEDLSNIQEATFNGYAAKGPANLFQAPFTDANGKARTQTNQMIFTCTGGGALNTVYGYYVTIIINAVEYLLMIEKFAQAKVMAAADDTLPLIVDLTAARDAAP